MTKRRRNSENSHHERSPYTPEKFQRERKQEPLKALTRTQGEYIERLYDSEQIVVMGPAGTGKTYIAGCRAADLLRNKQVSKVIITRPNVPGGRSLGFFPGTLEEKIAPWVAPLVSAISDRMGQGAFDIALKNGDIEIVPFEVMRGRSFKDAFIILDEAQNTTVDEIKMFLTRIGEDCQVVINGDVAQSDLKETSGLRRMIHLIKNQGLPVPIVEFTMDDIVRSNICAMWVRAFHANGE